MTSVMGQYTSHSTRKSGPQSDRLNMFKLRFAGGPIVARDSMLARFVVIPKNEDRVKNEY